MSGLLTEGRALASHRTESRSGTGEAPWAESADAVLARLDVHPARGLDEAGVQRRRARHGTNRLRAHRPRGDGAILADQFRSLIVGLLAVAALIAFAFGQVVEGLSILVVIALNAGIGFFTERRARRSMDALFALATVHTRVRRASIVRTVPAESLVPGDIVLIEAGDVITADLRLAEAAGLQIDESALTGESVPVTKAVPAVRADAPLAERASLLFKGSAVAAGSATAVVVSIGLDTELGRIAELVIATNDTRTPLEERLARLGHRLVGVTIAIAVAVSFAGILAGRDTFLMVETGLALAIAAIPEGLPVVATLALAGGMRRMARRRVLVRRLASVETLGSIGVICTDKTGTLTENRMTLVRLVLSPARWSRQRSRRSVNRRRKRATARPARWARKRRNAKRWRSVRCATTPRSVGRRRPTRPAAAQLPTGLRSKALLPTRGNTVMSPARRPARRTVRKTA